MNAGVDQAQNGQCKNYELSTLFNYFTKSSEMDCWASSADCFGPLFCNCGAVKDGVTVQAVYLQSHGAISEFCR